MYGLSLVTTEGCVARVDQLIRFSPFTGIFITQSSETLLHIDHNENGPNDSSEVRIILKLKCTDHE